MALWSVNFVSKTFNGETDTADTHSETVQLTVPTYANEHAKFFFQREIDLDIKYYLK